MSTEQYVERLLGEDADLERVIRVISEQGMPDISIAAGYGRLLTMLVRTSGAKQVLEIGALGGYSGICLARGLREGGQLTSLELVQNYADVARGNLEAAGFGGTGRAILLGMPKKAWLSLRSRANNMISSLSMRTKRIIRYIWSGQLLWRILALSLQGITRCSMDGQSIRRKMVLPF